MKVPYIIAEKMIDDVDFLTKEGKTKHGRIILGKFSNNVFSSSKWYGVEDGSNIAEEIIYKEDDL